jgi:prophage regulatory protein
MKRVYPVDTFSPNESIRVRFYRARDLAGMMAVGRSTLYELVRTGEFPKPVKVGSASVWPEEDYRKWRARKLLERKISETI